MKIDDEQFHRFASDVYKECAAIDLEPSRLVEISGDVLKLQSESKIEVDKLVPHLQSLLEQKKGLEGEISLLNKEKKKAAQEREDSLSKAKLTESLLEEYRTTKEELENHDVNFEDLGNLANILKNLSEHDFAIKEIIDKLQNEETLEVQIQGLQEQNKALEIKLQSRQQDLKQVKDNYDMISKKLNESKIKYGYLENTIKIIEELQRNGIAPLNILQWNNILISSKTPAYNLEEELRQYSGLKNVISNLQTNSDKLKNEKTGLESRIQTLKKEKEEIVSSIEQTKETAIKTIEETKSKAEELISSLQSETKSSMESLRAESSKQITNTAATAQVNLQNIVTSLDGTIAEISRTSQKFGEYRMLSPLFGIIAGDNVNPSDGYVSMDTLLNRFLRWTELQGIKNQNLQSYVKNLRAEINKEWEKVAKPR